MEINLTLGSERASWLWRPQENIITSDLINNLHSTRWKQPNEIWQVGQKEKRKNLSQLCLAPQGLLAAAALNWTQSSRARGFVYAQTSSVLWCERERARETETDRENLWKLVNAFGLGSDSIAFDTELVLISSRTTIRLYIFSTIKYLIHTTYIKQ